MAGQVEAGGEYPNSVPATVDYRASVRGVVFRTQPSVFDGSFDIS